MTSQMSDIRVRFFTQTDEHGASARLRAYAFAPYLIARGFQVTIDPLRRPPTGTVAYIQRFFDRLVAMQDLRATTDVIVLQRDLINHLRPWLEKAWAGLGIPMVLDVDDAIDLRPPGNKPTWRSRLLGSSNKLEQVSRLCDAVVAGNDYLADKILPWNENTHVIPTCLDFVHYPPRKPRKLPGNRQVVIGWIGSPLTTPYLELIHAPLARLAKERNIVFRTIGAAPLEWTDVPLDQRPWDDKTERFEVPAFDVGVMPLSDDEWSRSKCGTKIIQYFAFSVPTIASPVGMNVQACDEGRAGLLATTEDEWYEAFARLLSDADLYNELSIKGRERGERHYNTGAWADTWATILRDVRGAGRHE